MKTTLSEQISGRNTPLMFGAMTMSVVDNINISISHAGLRLTGSGHRLFDLLEMGMLIGAAGYLLHILV